MLALLLLAPIASGTVVEQRNRLPPPPDQDCVDPVSGVWMAHVYYEHVGQWYMFRLKVNQPKPGQLEGTIDSEWWNGNETNEQLPPCGKPHFRRAVFEPATGSWDGQRIEFNASSWTPKKGHPCTARIGRYLLDNFSGAVDEELQEFQSVLNADAPEWKDVPTVFRRVECGEPPKEEDPVVEVPPPFHPPAPELGCSLF